MKKIFIYLLFSTLGFYANANTDVNFQCDIFAVVGGGTAAGSLVLSGVDSNEQSYHLKISEGDVKESKDFDGVLHLRGKVEFAELSPEAQDAISSALKNSKKPSVTPGPLIVFTNTKDDSSTLRVYLMPSGEIAYIEVGFLPVLCG